MSAGKGERELGRTEDGWDPGEGGDLEVLWHCVECGAVAWSRWGGGERRRTPNVEASARVWG